MNVRIRVKYGDERLTIAEAADRVGISITAMRHRIMTGWPKEKLFSKERYFKGGNVRPANMERVKREYASPFLAAADGKITAEEYLLFEKERLS